MMCRLTRLKIEKKQDLISIGSCETSPPAESATCVEVPISVFQEPIVQLLTQHAEEKMSHLDALDATHVNI